MISKQLLQGRYTIIKNPTDPSQVMYTLYFNKFDSYTAVCQIKTGQKNYTASVIEAKKFERGVRFYNERPQRDRYVCLSGLCM